MSQEFQVVFAVAVFLVAYAVISSEKVHRTVVALFGAALLSITRIMSPEDAVHAIDFNTLGLLIGMMVIVGITRRTGVFEYLAIKAAKGAKGDPLAIMVALCSVTAVFSAFLDNVTTVLLIVPVTFAIAQRLTVSPLPILIGEILASNIGGTATLIGDPPNIMIGSATHLGFMDFVINLTPVVLVVYVATIAVLRLLYRKVLVAPPELRARVMELDERKEIKDPALLRKCLFVLFLVISGFVIHQYVHLESSVIALSGASLLLVLLREDPEHALHAVEWPVIFFFAGLFIIVGALEKLGVIAAIARFALEVTGGEVVTTAVLVLWLSAVASAFVDNIPFVATMIPMIQEMGRLGGISGTELDLLWWSLALGACLGGNGTIIGASANVIVAGMAERRGVPITFAGFFKVAFPLMLLSIAISNLYILFWYRYHGIISLAATFGLGLLLILLQNLLGGRARQRNKSAATGNG